MLPQTGGILQIFHMNKRFPILWNPTLWEGSCDVVCGSRVDKITSVMSRLEPKLDMKLTERTQGFIVHQKLKELRKQGSTCQLDSAFKTGSYKEINSGVFSLNLVNLKITHT